MSRCKKRGLKFSFTFTKLRAGGVALVALSAKNCASIVVPCMPSALSSPVLAIARRRKFNHSSRPSRPEELRDNCAKRATTKADDVGLGLRYDAIKPQLYYDCAMIAPR